MAGPDSRVLLSADPGGSGGRCMNPGPGPERTRCSVPRLSVPVTDRLVSPMARRVGRASAVGPGAGQARVFVVIHRYGPGNACRTPV